MSGPTHSVVARKSFDLEKNSALLHAACVLTTVPTHMKTLETRERQIWVDGRLVPWNQATVHVLSHSLQRGSLVFDYMSVHQTPRGAGVFRLVEHAARFLRSCELVGLDLGRTAASVSDAVLETVRANPGATAVKTSA